MAAGGETGERGAGSEGGDQAELLLLTDGGGRVVLAEGPGMASFGLRAADTIGRPIAEACPAWPALAHGADRALQGRRHRQVVDTGSARIELAFEPRRDEGDRIVGALVHGEPVRQELCGAGLSLLLGHVPCLILSTDGQLGIEQVVGQVHEALGFARRAAPGMTVAELLGRDGEAPGTDPILQACHDALAGQARSLRHELAGRSFEVHVAPLPTERRDGDPGRQGCVLAAVEVTRQRQTEEGLSRTEQRLTEAQRIAHVGSWEWDVASNRVHWSEELHRIYGFEPGTFGGTYEAFVERVLPEDREYTRAVVFDAYREVKPFVYDHRVVRPDGAVRMLHTRGAVLADAAGKVVRLAGACWDITELWQASGELQRSTSLLRATLESTADGLLVIDRQGKVAAYNQRLLDLWGLPREMMAQRTFDDLLCLVHDQLENGEDCLRRVRQLDSEPDAESFDSLRFKDGRFFERYSRPQRLGEEVVGRVWSYREVTDREQLLRRTLFLSDASRLLVSLEVEKALEGVAHLALPFIGDACAVDLFTDGEPRRLLVLSRDPTRSIAAQLGPATLRGQAATYNVGPDSYLTVPLMSHGELLGALTFAAASGRRYTEADLALASELARRVELSLQNARLYRRAQDALAARDEFLSVAAHEIRGPLTSLHLAVQGLRQDPGQPISGRLLAIIEREDRRVGDLVSELLDLARIRSGQLRFVFGPVDLVEVVRETASRLAPELARSGSTLSITGPSTVVGSWDRARLEQVVSNLLANAIKFGLGKPIDVRVEGGQGHAEVQVSDRGIGIAAELQERVFEPFERAVSARHYGGLGLGLYIVRTAVEGMGGHVTLKSQPGQGTTFVVDLPQTRSA